MAASVASAMLGPDRDDQKNAETFRAMAIVVIALAGLLDKPAVAGGHAAIKPRGA